MELEDVIEEYVYYCLAKGFTKKTLISKKQVLKNLKRFLDEKRGVTRLQNVYLDDLEAYIRYKQQSGLQPRSTMSMYKMVSAFFKICVLKKTTPKKI